MSQSTTMTRSPISMAFLLDCMRQGVAATAHSGEVRPGDVFVVMPSLRGSKDGTQFIPQALEAGAAYLVMQEDAPVPDGIDIPVIPVPDPRQALGELAAAHFRTQSLPFKLIGVTGTNGKTSICAMLEHLFARMGKPTGMLGTIRQRWPGVDRPAALTTSGCWELHAMMAAMRDAGTQVACMEVSSHALDQQRVAGLSFDGAILTNITQDHLDYHTDMEDYARAKFRLFLQYTAQDKAIAINADDIYGARLLSLMEHGVGFGLHPVDTVREDRFLNGVILEHGIDGMTLECRYQGDVWRLSSPLVGEYNASNLLAVMAMGLQLGCGVQDLQALETFTGVAGRLERVPNAKGRHVFVDYAHTPDALENVLKNLDLLRRGRLITVFGCGGDRDKSKRPLMGRAACRYSEIAVLTSDNPRTEDPEAIMADVEPGLVGCRHVMRIADRREAIAAALQAMDASDICVIAGKGHEDYQIIGTTKYPFSDQAVVRDVLGDPAGALVEETA